MTGGGTEGGADGGAGIGVGVADASPWHVVANFGASVAVRPVADDGRDDAVGGAETPPEQALPLRSLPLLVAGDRVRCAADSGGARRVVELLPRTSVLERPDQRGRPKPLAANLTHLAVVSAAPPGIDTLLIDEFCVGAQRAGIGALIVVNKADLLDEGSHAAVRAMLDVYADVGHPVVLVDARSETGVAPLERELAGRTAALVGASGVGKSSIVQRLLPDLEVRIGAISASTGLGAHTTSVTLRYALPCGGAVIDSPGVRRYSVAHVDARDVRAGYREIARLAAGCRFGDCAHVVEPGCAVREGLERGTVARWRYANYRKLAGV